MSSLFSVSGLSSGLDTDSIIRQLMQIERIPVVRYQQQQAELRRVDDAWAKIVAKLSGLRTAVDGIKTADKYAAHVSTTSSNADVVTATKTGSPATGSVSFTVEQLATTHQVAAGQALTGPDSLVGAGTFTVTMADGSTKSVTTDGTTTLAQLQEKIQALKAGVNAAVMKTGENSYRLVLTAASSGAAGAFTVSQTPPGLDNTKTKILTQAQDARLRMGTTADALVVSRSSNTVTDLIDGVSLELKATSATAVTITTARDNAATAKSVKDVVEAFKGLVSTVTDLTKYDAGTKKAGVLQGSPEARQLVDSLRAAFMAPSGTGAYRSFADLGVSFDRYGAVQFDEAKLTKALETDYNAVVSVLSRTSATFTGSGATLLLSGDAVPGTYAVSVSQLASKATTTSALTYPPNGNVTYGFTIGVGGKNVAISLNSKTAGQDTLAGAVTTINNALAANGVTSLEAVASGSKIELRAKAVGSATSFTLTNTQGALWTAGTYAGTDVKGTIGGVAATGSGNTLSATSGDAKGISLNITATATGALGSVTVDRGILSVVSHRMSTWEGSAGRIQASRDGISADIRRLDDTIAAYELRLTQRETTLRRRFTALETALARSQSQGAWLAGQLGGLQANNG